MLRIRTIVLVLLIGTKVFCQTPKNCPYQIDWKNEIILSGIGITLSLGDIWLKHNQSELTPTEIQNLDPTSINRFDRAATYNSSQSSLNTSNVLKYSGWLLPASLLASKEIRKDFWVVAVMAFEAKLLTHAVTGITKGMVQRIRPYAYNDQIMLENKTSKSAKRSFFSGHTSNYAVLSFFTAKVISDYSSNRSLKIAAWSFAFVSSAYMGYLRVDAGKHFKTDVITGLLAGAALGVIIPKLHKKKKDKKSLSILPYFNNKSTGLYLTWHLSRN